MASQPPSRRPSSNARSMSSTSVSTPFTQATILSGMAPFDFSVSSGEALFPDPVLATPDDFALSDFEVADPFFRGLTLDSTSESSPEATVIHSPPQQQNSINQSILPHRNQPNGVSQQSTPASGPPRQPMQNAISPAQWEALSQVTNRYNSLLEDINDSPLEVDMSNSNNHTVVNPSDLDASRNTNELHKRTKDKNESISACWTSPLCPNYAKEGTPPSPSTCGGACAPFLFSNEVNDLSNNNDTQAAREQVEIDNEKDAQAAAQQNSNPRRQLKRRDSSKASGRTKSTDSVHTIPEVKHESSPDSTSPADLPTIAETPAAGNNAKPKRMPHHQVERKYRETINTQLEALRRVVPSLQQPSPGNCNDDADIEDLPLPPAKPSKAVVLASATSHIKQIEKERKKLAEENRFLRERVKALQALVKCEDCTLMQYIMDMKVGA